MKFRLLLLIILFLVLFGAACEVTPTLTDPQDQVSSNKSEPVDIQEDEQRSSIGDAADPVIVAQLPFSSRSFEMGTAGFVPRHFPNSSEDDWRDFFDVGAASYGGIYGVHIKPGEKVNRDGIIEQAQLAFEQMKGIRPYIAFSINYEDGPFTQERGEELKRVAVAVAKKYQPKYISLGVESDSFYLFQQDTFDLYVEYARKIYDEIKEVSPNTLVMNNFQLDRMKGGASLTGQVFDPNWYIIDMFAGKVDLISFTVYPFLEYKSVEEIPDNYLAEIREYTSLPIIITETGWPSENLTSGVTGSYQDQIDYMMKLVQQANGIDVEVIIWVFPHDAQFGIAGGVFDHISLLDEDGNPKPGYAYWQAINALPLK